MLAPNALAPAAPKLHDVTVVTRKNYSCVRVEGVPPEEFGISRHAKSIGDCGYCFHEVLKTQSQLIEDGFDEAQIQALPSYNQAETTESRARDTVDEAGSSHGDEGVNKANRLIKVTEHYVRMDYEGDGKAKLYRVTTVGDKGEILKIDGKEDISEVDVIPFAAMTPVIMTHRFFGRSVADLVMDLQRQKTALVRGLLDNIYMVTQPRVEIAESHASENTLDDLLVSRPNGIIRTKQPGGLNWQVVPTIADSVYPALQYLDATREWRTGVSRQGQGVDPNALQNQVATIANQMFNASQAKVKLIARIFAETGIRDLFSLLHATIRKNGQQAETVRLRNQWVTVDPREWKERNDLTISVGLGTGSKEQQLAGAQLMIGAQEKGIAAGLVSKQNLFNSAKQLTRLLGHKDPEEFFTNPSTPPDPNNPSAVPIEPPPDPKMAQLQIQAQLDEKADERKAQIEAVQAQADIQTQKDKTQAEMIQAEREYQLKEQLALLQAELDREKFKREEDRREREFQQKLAHNDQMHEQSMTQAKVGIIASAQAHEQKMEQTKAQTDK